MFAQLAHLVYAAFASFRFLLLALALALCFFPLFLLACLFFLALVKSRSASWHSQSLLSFVYHWPGSMPRPAKYSKNRKCVKVRHGVSALCNSGSVPASSTGRLNLGA